MLRNTGGNAVAAQGIGIGGVGGGLIPATSISRSGVGRQLMTGAHSRPRFILAVDAVQRIVDHVRVDAAAHNMQVTEEPTYDVRFHSEELWPGSSDEAFIHVGLFQSYLEKTG